jgi:hypothetical protein
LVEYVFLNHDVWMHVARNGAARGVGVEPEDVAAVDRSVRIAHGSLLTSEQK